MDDPGGPQVGRISDVNSFGSGWAPVAPDPTKSWINYLQALDPSTSLGQNKAESIHSLSELN